MERLSYTVERFGAEGEPVVIIDNFAPDPDALRGVAAGMKFRRIGPFYPGVRAQADPSYVSRQDSAITDMLANVFGFKDGAQITEAAFSVVSTPPAELMPIQCLPHYDGTDEGRLAVLHYLSGARAGGTAFYRHRATGFETITDDRFEAYKAALYQEAEAFGLPAKDYCRGNTEQFEQIGLIPAADNRCIVYRGITLHSGFIPETAVLNPDPKLGRLTVNIFMLKRPPE